MTTRLIEAGIRQRRMPAARAMTQYNGKGRPSKENGRNKRLPQRRHLRRLDIIFSDLAPIIYFITVCTHRRRPVLTEAGIADVVTKALVTADSDHGWVVGRYA